MGNCCSFYDDDTSTFYYDYNEYCTICKGTGYYHVGYNEAGSPIYLECTFCNKN